MSPDAESIDPIVFDTRWEAKRFLVSRLWTYTPRPYHLILAILTTLRRERWLIIERGFNICVYPSREDS